MNLIDDTLARGAGKMQLIHRLVDGALARARFKHAHSTVYYDSACCGWRALGTLAGLGM